MLNASQSSRLEHSIVVHWCVCGILYKISTRGKSTHIFHWLIVKMKANPSHGVHGKVCVATVCECVRIVIHQTPGLQDNSSSMPYMCWYFHFPFCCRCRWRCFCFCWAMDFHVLYTFFFLYVRLVRPVCVCTYYVWFDMKAKKKMFPCYGLLLNQ